MLTKVKCEPGVSVDATRLTVQTDRMPATSVDGDVMPRGAALRRLLEERGWSQADAARHYRCSRPAVSVAYKEDSGTLWYAACWPWQPRSEHCDPRHFFPRQLNALTRRDKGLPLSPAEYDELAEVLDYLETNRLVIGYHPDMLGSAGWYLRTRRRQERVTLGYLVCDQVAPVRFAA